MKKFEEYILNELNTNIDEQISDMLTKTLSHIKGVKHIEFNTAEKRCNISIHINSDNLDNHLKQVKEIKKYFNAMFKPLIEKIGTDKEGILIYFEINKKECDDFNLYKSLTGMNSFNL